MAASLSAKLAIPVSARDHAQGPKSAPVTLVEYGDFECPHCAAAHVIIRKVQEAMGDQLRFVFRHFPLTQIHANAETAAEAAEAAGAQGQFWELHDLLFENQSKLDLPDMMTFAEELGLDTQRFFSEVSTGVHHERVRADFLGGVRSGVNGTPGFFINGLRYDDAWDFRTLLEALESESK
jgi:protein-disulfide isomerase